MASANRDFRLEPFNGIAQWTFATEGQRLFQIYVSYTGSPLHSYGAEYTVRGAIPVGNTTLTSTIVDQR